jgi:short-subunit dehydrogenase
MQNIIITGGSRGIGKALALELAEDNVFLGLVGMNQEKLASVKTLCQQKGADVKILICDVSTEHEKLKDWIDQIDQQHPIDLFVANAGITATTKENELEDWTLAKSIIDTNITGLMASVYPAIKKMQSRKSGNIILMSSLAAYYGLPTTPAYCASKAAVKSYGESLDLLLSKDNINVLTVFPGYINTDMTRDNFSSTPFLMSEEKAVKKIIKANKNHKRTLSFPLLLNIGVHLLTILPSFIKRKAFKQ